MSNSTVSKLWMVSEGVWMPMEPTPEWFRKFLHSLMTKEIKEIANGNTVAPRTKYATKDPDQVLIVEWRK